MRRPQMLLIPAVALSLALAACGSSSSSQTATSASTSAPPASSSAAAGVVKTASNSTVGATILVSAQGRTLYHLSAEKNGKFICTSSACVGVWAPVSASATSASVSGLGTVKRPDGSEQLAYNGEPLYTFSGDKAAGEANGQGVKDVGTWSAVVTSAGSAGASQTAPATPASASESSGGESSGGGSSGGSGGYAY